MPLKTPELPRARAGHPVTAQAWNALIKGVGDFFDAIPTVGGDYVQVNVLYRQGPVPGARVVALPVAAIGGPRTGAPLQAAPDGGAGSGFRFRVVAAGIWAVYVEAPGFAPAKRHVEVPPTGPPVTTLDVELTPTHRAVPDVVGFASFTAAAALTWSDFAIGLSRDFVGWTPRAGDGVVLVQGPAAGVLVPLDQRGGAGDTPAVVSTVDRPFAGFVAGGPWRTIVPDLVGLPEREVFTLGSAGLVDVREERSGGDAAGELMIVDQRPRGGAVVAPGSKVVVVVERLVHNRAKLTKFAGTHAGLAEETGVALHDWVHSLLTYPFAAAAPWAWARLAATDETITLLTEHFAEMGIAIGPRPGEGLAEAWQSVIIANRIGFGG